MAGIDMKYGINTRVRGIGLEFSAGTSYRDEADCGCSSLAWPGPLSNAPGPLTRGQVRSKVQMFGLMMMSACLPVFGAYFQ
ncbi:hypothetical protein JYU34_018479 [Plutella xylostella]|uniref:Uncharacterized protein n=1 Tax=Plutella xylostella TaxID=51655 RepID=A0ABQ7PXX9_PLUXY|nr:hypothetical protein JYU34_018479 [Plutella xylostella]